MYLDNNFSWQKYHFFGQSNFECPALTGNMTKNSPYDAFPKASLQNITAKTLGAKCS